MGLLGDDDIAIKVQVDTSGAVRGFSEADAAQKKFEKGVQQLGQSIDKLTGDAKLKKLEADAKAAFATAPAGEKLADSLKKIGAEAQKAGVSVADINKHFRQAKFELDATNQAASDHVSAITKVVAAYVGFQAVSSIIGEARSEFEALGSTLQNALKVENLSRSFTALQGSVGQVASRTLPALRSATQGLVSDLDLMQAANKAVLLGVDKGNGEFPKLAAAATKLGQAMGIDAAKAIDSLVIGIGRQSSKVLDNLGIIVKTEDAYKKYALSLHKTVDALSDTERATAFAAAAQTAIEKKSRDIAAAQETAAQAFTKLSVEAENQKNAFSTGVSSSDSLRDALISLREVLASVNFEQVGRDVGDLAQNLVKAATGAAAFGAEFVNSIALGARVAAEQKRLQDNTGFLGGLGRNIPDEASTNVAKQIVTEEDARIVQKQLAAITASVKSLKDEAEFSKAQTALANYSAQALKSGVDFTSFKDKFQAAQKSLAEGAKNFRETGKSIIDHEEDVRAAADAQELLAKQTKSTNQDIDRQAAKVALVAGKDGFPKLTAAIKEAISTGKNSTEIAGNLKAVNEQFTKQGVSADEVKARVDSAFGGISKSIKSGESEAQKFAKSVQDIGAEIVDLTTNKSAIDSLKASLEGVFTDALRGGNTNAAVAALEDLRQGFVHNQHEADLFKKLVPEAFKAVQQEAKKTTDELNKLNKELSRNDEGSNPALKGVSDEVTNLQQERQERKLSFEEYDNAIKLLGQDFVLAGGSAQTFFDVVKKGKETVDASGKDGSLRGLVNSATGSSFSAGSFFGFDLGDGISKEAQKSLASGLESSVTSALQSVAQGGDWKAAAQQLGNGIGNAVGNAVAPGLGPIGGIIIGQITKDLTSSKSSELLRGLLTVTLGPTGFLAGSLLQQGKSQGSKDRRALDKYFNDLFDHTHLQAIINGQLKQIKDLDFVGNQDKSKGVFAGLSEDAKKQFGAVGDALQLLQGQALDLGVNLDAVLANNLGGDLENLSVLLKQMGVSFEDLGNQIINSFLKGDESINQAYQDLLALDQLAHGGAFKDLSDAFTTFQEAEASGQGSQQLIDSIRAIGAEAQKLHLKTLPDLANYLVNTLHQDAGQVAIFFEAMKASGLNSITDLENAFTSQLIQFAHNVSQITAGAAPDTVTPNLPPPENYTPPTNFTAGSFSKTGGGGGSKSGGSKSGGGAAKDNTISNLQSLVTASDDYKAVLASLKGDLISNAQAGSILKNLYAEGTKVTKDLTKAQEAYDAAVKKGVGGAKLAELAAALDKAKSASENFGKVDLNLDKLKLLNSDVHALSVLAKGAGLEFQKLDDDITAAFSTGALSIDQAKNKLDELTNALSNGGDKSPSEAFKNFLEGGKNGGQFSIEQFKAIFSTAKTAGLSSLSQVQSQLAGQFDPRQIAKIFTVLGQQGFNTFDDLKNISDTAVVDILGKLNKLNFPFQDTSNRVKKILEQMNALSAPRTVDIVLNFKSNIDSGTKNLLELAGVKVPGQEATKSAGVGGSKRRTTTQTRTQSRVIHR